MSAGITFSHCVCRALLVGWMQALFAPESTTRSIRALSPQRLVDYAALHPPYGKPVHRRLKAVPLITLHLSLALLVLALAAPAFAADSSRVPKPVIEAAKGEKCVEGTEFMRRNHMELLRHQRDATMHQGIRTTKYSLNGCIDCHASRKNNSVAGSDQNFCQSCHSYTAVKLDCFECHASKPRTPAERAAIKQIGAAPIGTGQAVK